MKFLFSAVLLSTQILFAEPCEQDYVRAAQNPDYFKHVVLTGVVKQMVFPGPPDFFSVESGDWAEPRTILEVDESSLCRLVGAQSQITSNHYLGDFIDSALNENEPNARLVTLDSSFTGESVNIELHEDKLVVIDAVISAQPAHGHTPFVVEIAEVLFHE